MLGEINFKKTILLGKMSKKYFLGKNKFQKVFFRVNFQKIFFGENKFQKVFFRINFQKMFFWGK